MESMEQAHSYTGRGSVGGCLPQEGAAQGAATTTTAHSCTYGFLDGQSQHD